MSHAVMWSHPSHLCAHGKAVRGLLADKTVIVYKKVDSTCRGNIGPEVYRVMATLGASICLFAPVCIGFELGASRNVISGIWFNVSRYIHILQRVAQNPASPPSFAT